MRYIIALYFATLVIWICIRVFRLAQQERVELFSTHTMFLAGFIIFQLTSSILGLGFDLFGDLQPANFRKTPLIFAAMVTIFLILFEWGYKRDWSILARLRRSGADWDGNASGWILLALVMTFFGFLLKVVFVMIPLVGIITSQAATGVLAAAAGCAAWGWSKNFRSAGLASMALVILMTASLIMLYQSFGRRAALGIILGFGWAIYYAYWRVLPKGVMIRWLAIAGIIASLVLTLYTATRTARDAFENRSMGDALRAISEVRLEDMTAGYVAILTGQNSGPLSMWAIETYGRGYPYDFLHQIKFLVTIPIPREFWPGKPQPLAKEMVYHGHVRNKGGGNVYNVGPGIIGHTAHDFPWIALPLYAIGLGWMLRMIDERTVWSFHRPFILIPCGAALGQTLALARGETALFVWEIGVAIVSAYIAMRIGGRVVTFLGLMWMTDELPPQDPTMTAEDWGDQYYEGTV
jgi:hypothetical protein